MSALKLKGVRRHRAGQFLEFLCTLLTWTVVQMWRACSPVLAGQAWRAWPLPPCPRHLSGAEPFSTPVTCLLLVKVRKSTRHPGPLLRQQLPSNEKVKSLGVSGQQAAVRNLWFPTHCTCSELLSLLCITRGVCSRVVTREPLACQACAGLVFPGCSLRDGLGHLVGGERDAPEWRPHRPPSPPAAPPILPPHGVLAPRGGALRFPVSIFSLPPPRRPQRSSRQGDSHAHKRVQILLEASGGFCLSHFYVTLATGW